MSYQGQDPNQPGQSGQYSGQYGGYVPPQQPQPTDPYSGQQYGQQQGYQAPYGQQQGYQAPYGQSPYSAAGQGKTSMGLEPNVAAGLSYILGWITGLIFFLTEKQNRFVRFHAMQSIILSGSYTVLAIIIQVISAVSGTLGLILGCLSSILGIVVLVFAIIALVNAFQGKYYKLPIIGDYAERYANPPATM